MTAALDPSQPAPGDLVTVTIMLHNGGDGPATGIALRDEVSGNATVRSAVAVPRAGASPGGRPVARDLTRSLYTALAPGGPAKRLHGQATFTTGHDGDCQVMARHASCQLGDLEPGATATTKVRLLIDPDPASPRLAQQISLASGQQALVAGQDVSTLIGEGPSRANPLGSLPGSTVRLVAFMGLVLAAKARVGRDS